MPYTCNPEVCTDPETCHACFRPVCPMGGCSDGRWDHRTGYGYICHECEEKIQKEDAVIARFKEELLDKAKDKPWVEELRNILSLHRVAFQDK